MCFCNSNDPDPHACSAESHSVRVMKGQIFNVSVIAVDQINQSLSNISIYASLRDPESGMGEGQVVQSTAESCTNLTFSIYSKNSTEDLILYAKGPCKNATRSRKTIKIHFLNCRCPIGFSRWLAVAHVSVTPDCSNTLPTVTPQHIHLKEMETFGSPTFYET